MAQQVVRAVVKGTLFNSVQTRNIFCYGSDQAGPANTEVASAIVSNLDDLYSALIGYMTTAFQVYEYEFQNLIEGEWQPLTTVTKAISGTNNDASGSFQVAALLTAKTSVFKARGRKFLPGFSLSGMTDGAWEAAVVEYLGVALLAYLANANAGQWGVWAPGVVSKNSQFAPFTSGIVSDVISTMRRRKPGYGI